MIEVRSDNESVQELSVESELFTKAAAPGSSVSVEQVGDTVSPALEEGRKRKNNKSQNKRDAARKAELEFHTLQNQFDDTRAWVEQRYKLSLEHL